MRSADELVLRLPSKLLDVGAVVSEDDGPAKLGHLVLPDVRDAFEVAVRDGELRRVLDEVAQGDGRPVLRALGLQRVELDLVAERVERQASENSKKYIVTN